MKITKRTAATKDDIQLSGSVEITKLSIILASLCNCVSNIKNVSNAAEIDDLVNILEQFGVKTVQNNDITTINGKNISLWQQPNNVVNVKSSFDILNYILNIVLSCNFRVFFTGNDDFINKNFSYLKYVGLGDNLMFKKNYELPLLSNGNYNIKNNNLVVDDVIKKNSLLFNFFANDRECVILDKSVKSEYLEEILKFYGVELKEIITENKTLLTREMRKSKEIFLKKGTKIDGSRYFTVPADITESIYSIFIGLMLNAPKFTIKNVSLNELNNDVVKVLIENGVNIEFKNQKILNGIKVVDLIVGESFLKSTTISKGRLMNIMNIYPLLIMLNVIKRNEIKIIGLKELKTADGDNYNNFIKVLKSINVSVNEDKDTLTINCDNVKLVDNIDLDKSTLDTKTKLALFLSNIALSRGIFYKSKIEDFESIFPNLKNVVEQFGLEIIYEN